MTRAALLACALLAACEGRTSPNDPPPVRREAGTSARWVRAAPARAALRWEAPAVARVDGLGTGDVTASVRVRIARVILQPGDEVTAGQAVAEVEAPEVLRALGARAAASGRVAPLRAWSVELRAQRDAGFARLSEVSGF